ncbi:serine/threonine-protein kinase [Amycolatopsis benzoatilytica]|uniref:serine/threonine-protein kinase n=1 Tax=Amycolatopsis benzoatilytica TaxID=346045 RepID=UPI00037A24FE|nr:serine/threonine-protein kinase [Amycolatopsis benzoatilytica]
MGSSRISRHVGASTALSLLSDAQLLDRLSAAEVLSEGIGGTGAKLDVDGVPVFAKRVPLTALEQRHRHSTANLYGLPAFCHYGLGSPEGSAWRELALHVMANGWVLGGECANFPLLHHWRVLPVASGRVPDRSLEEDVAYWGGSPAVRRRLTELRDATDSIVFFCEFFPTTLHRWLPTNLDAAPRVEEQVLETVSFLRAQGVLHFDNHFDNFLTDGERLYLTDFGLAFSRRFELSEEEREFFERNVGHDHGYAAMYLVNWLVTELHGTWDRDARLAAVRKAARGELELSAPVAEVVARHAEAAVAMNDFYSRLQENRDEPFPAAVTGRTRP